MRILICNERFLFRFGVDRVLLMLGSIWKSQGNEVIMMGNKLDSAAVEKCSDRFIFVPEAPDYLHGNDYTLEYIEKHWDAWFNNEEAPDIALIAGWPFYRCINFLRGKCGTAIFHDYGAVPMEGMSEPQRITQTELRRLRKENLKYADRIIAISSFLEETQSKKDAEEADHVIPTSNVLLGIDHLDMHLWNKEELDIAQKDVLKDIEKFKKEGYKIIFQPGRWENGNYKNSSACIDVIKKLNEKNIRHKILVLSKLEEMGELPEGTEDSFYCLGFVDDNTMRKAMELSDAGMSPTLWEGFDLPLGEMQYLNRPMFVLNVGAHPEVVANPYFLCEDMDELGNKLTGFLEKGLPFSEEEFLADCEKFRKNFTWAGCASKMLSEFNKAIASAVTIFIDVTNACHDTANSGVMRVTRTVSHYLQKRADTVFVLWDDSIHKYVFPYDEEVELLCAYGGPKASKISYRSCAGQSRLTLDDVFTQFEGRRKVHLFTETVNHNTLRNATTYFYSKGVPVAAIFYDAIAVNRPELCSKEVSDNHGKYMMGLADIDVVIPIASHNGKDLKKFWDENKVGGTLIRDVELAAEMNGVERIQKKTWTVNGDIRILFVSTLEPRKNHIRFLKGLEKLFRDHPETEDRIILHMVGNRYAGNDEIPKYVEEFCKKHKNAEWLGVVDDETLRKEYRDCTFTAYPSEIEGFGMPIIESLWFGKPCLCSDSGSIGELGGKGGCALTDILSIDSIAKTVYRLIDDQDYYLTLQHEACDRHITTWDEYTDSVCEILSALRFDHNKYHRIVFPSEMLARLNDYYEGWTGKRLMVVSNFYPPNFVGGAEIIAHNQARALLEQGYAKPIAFSLDVTGEKIPGTVYMEECEGIPVVRTVLSGEAFYADGVNFFNKDINEAFEELCKLVRPDVVHCHNIIGMSLGIIDIARSRGIKTVVTLHDNWGFCYKNTLLDNQERLCDDYLACDKCKSSLRAGGINIPIGVRKEYFRRIFETIDIYISPSRYLADTYLRAGFDFHKMNVLWNGINIKKFSEVQNVPSDKIRISVIAYFGRHKGIDTLIKAVGLLGRNDVEISLVGSGEEEENYRKTAAEQGILHQLRFWGKVANQDIGNVFAETDIYCLPSIWPENQPVSITEAMACGLPVVASDLGGSRELVTDGKTGLLFEAGNERDLAEKLGVLLDNVTLRKEYGEAGRAVIRKYSFEKQAEALVRLYYEKTDVQDSGKKIVAIKGNVFPTGIEKVINMDTLHLDWILRDEDFDEVVACVLLAGERFTSEEMEKLKKRDILLLVPASEYKAYREQEMQVTEYENDVDLLRKLSIIKG